MRSAEFPGKSDEKLFKPAVRLVYNQTRGACANTMLFADWFSTDRSRSAGVAEALAVAATLPARSRILDAGCGNGVPVAEALVNAGYRVVGLDSSAGMLTRIQANLPGTPVVRGDARRCPFVNGGFDAAISMEMMFYLPCGNQAAAFASVSRVLNAGIQMACLDPLHRSVHAQERFSQ